MTREFQENTVAIILNEMFNDSKKLKTQMQFDALIEKYAERIVKLFFIPDVSVSFSAKEMENFAAYMLIQHNGGNKLKTYEHLKVWLANER